MQFERQQAEAVGAEHKQVTEKQGSNEQRRYGQSQPQIAFAQGDPRHQRPQRKPDAADVVHGADEKDVIIEQRKRRQRKHRPTAVELPIERERARQDQHEARDHIGLPRRIDAHEPHQHRHDHVHHQVGNDLPVHLIETGEVGIVADRGDDVHAREMIDVVRNRRQRMKQNRNSRNEREQNEQGGNLPAGEVEDWRLSVVVMCR